MLSSAYTLAQKAKAVVALVGAVATYLLTVATAESPAVLDWELPGTSLELGYVLALIAAVATGFVTFVTKNAPVLEPRPADGQPPIAPH